MKIASRQWYIFASTVFIIMLLGAMISLVPDPVRSMLLLGAIFIIVISALAGFVAPYFYLFLLIVFGFPVGRGYLIGTVPLSGFRIFFVEIAGVLASTVWLITMTLKRWRLTRGYVQKAVGFFEIGVACMTVLGVLRGNEFAFVLADIRPLLYYLMIFPLKEFFLREGSLRRICNIIVWGSALYAVLVFSGYLPWGGFVRVYFYRGQYQSFRLVLSNDYHMIFVIPLLMGLFRHLGARRFFPYFPAILLIIAKLAFSQWRGIWIATLITASFMIFDWLKKPIRVAYMRLALFVLVISVSVGLVTALLYLRNPELITQLIMRVKSILVITDESYNMRFTQLRRSLTQIRLDFVGVWLGSGIGSTFSLSSRGNSYESAFVDNLFVTLFHKGGILGLVLFLAIFGRYKRRIDSLMKKRANIANPYVLAFIESAACSLYGFLFTGISTSVLISYPAIFAFVVVLALVEALTVKISSSLCRDEFLREVPGAIHCEGVASQSA